MLYLSPILYPKSSPLSDPASASIENKMINTNREITIKEKL
jgi:hypothetical protein